MIVSIILITSGTIFFVSLGLIVLILFKLSKGIKVTDVQKNVSLRKFALDELSYFEKVLQKILISLRILILKADSGTYKVLNKLREKAKRRIKDKYWEELKKAKKE
ncbi:hypothetical protein HRbin34_00350 [bacterium HR34]|nr:hypothetical protein HRbin34_00350 [bacterium HR34]